MIFQYNECVGDCILIGKQINNMALCQFLKFLPLTLTLVGLFCAIKVARYYKKRQMDEIINQEKRRIKK